MTIDADKLKQMIADDDLGLLDLSVKSKPVSAEERLVASFTEITEFARAHDRPPELNAADMGESKLYWRLEAINKDDDKREFLTEHDELGLLKAPEPPESISEVVEDDDLGLLDEPAEDIFSMRNVPKTVAAPDEVAQREPAQDFDQFKPLFEQCHAELRAGTRELIKFRNEQQIEQGKFYVLGGVLAYVDEIGERKKSGGKVNARIRCIFENGTESGMLLRSLSRGLYKDGKSVTEPHEKTLREMGLDPETKMGSVYVLRSLSEDEQVKAIPNLHKIGSTTESVGRRTGRAEAEETFLGAPVEVVAEYQLPAAAVRKLEGMLHRFFAGVQIDAWFERDGGKVSAEMREWFSVPLGAIDEAIKLVEAEAIQSYEWDADTQSMKLRG